MKLPGKILVASDFKAHSDVLLKRARTTARMVGSDIDLVAVCPDDLTSAQGAVEHARLTEALADAARTLSDVNLKVQTHLLSGLPFVEIIQFADSENASVVLVGSGSEVDERFPLGITAERVVRRCNRPVWVVRPDENPSIRRILCPVDGSAPSLRALRNAMTLARLHDARLDVLKVLPLAEGDLGNGTEQTAARASESDHLNRFIRKLDASGVSVEAHVRHGVPHREILAAARAFEVDLVLMGSVGASDNPRILMGRVAEKVLREVPCSFLALKTQDPVRLTLSTEMQGLEDHLKRGRELMAHGFFEEAILHFDACLFSDAYFHEVLDAKADAQLKLGLVDEAEVSRSRARRVRESGVRSDPDGVETF